ncbi:hypothetical protein QBC44DRAFT_251457 [Cladorrhinum sp. PSN332]|nr:hypothetical protein QBC44DRAFT_251457 [Cladorrhinum sp. PSN332]
MPNLKSLLIATATLSIPAATVTASAVDFTNSFDGITAGSDITLTWPTSSQSAGLCITAQVIDRGEEGSAGGKANAYKVNVTTTATGNEYTWSGVPYPLRRVKNGLYQVEARDCSGSQLSNTVIAKSPFFSVEEDEEEGVISDPVPSSSASVSFYAQSPPAINKTALGIGLGVAIGVPSVAGLAVVGWCFRKRQRRAAEERRRARRREFVIY